MLSEKQLRAAAKELNKSIGLDPAINADAPVKNLANEIKEVAEDKELVKPGDKFTAATQLVLDVLTGKVKEEPDEAEAAAEKIHKRNVGDKKVNEGKEPIEEPEEDETPEEAEEEKPKRKAGATAEKKAPATKKPAGKTKKSIIEGLLATKTGAMIEEMAQAMVDEGVDTDYKKNLVVTKLWLSKMGFDTKKAAIEKNPKFKAK